MPDRFATAASSDMLMVMMMMMLMMVVMMVVMVKVMTVARMANYRVVYRAAIDWGHLS